MIAITKNVFSLRLTNVQKIQTSIGTTADKEKISAQRSGYEIAAY